MYNLLIISTDTLEEQANRNYIIRNVNESSGDVDLTVSKEANKNHK